MIFIGEEDFGKVIVLKEGWDGDAGGESGQEFSFKTSRVWDAYMSPKELLSGK